jgi:hypothetical protein
MRFPNYPGVGERIQARLRALGYVLDDGRIDAARFIRERQYDPRSFYPWLKKRTPSPDMLERLSADLQVSKSWLLLGEEPRRLAKAAKRGAAAFLLVLGLATPSAADAPHPLSEVVQANHLLLIGYVRRLLGKLLPFHAAPAHAI